MRCCTFGAVPKQAMATNAFPTRRDFYVMIGDKNEGINFEVDGGAADNFTGYNITLNVRCPNGQSFSRTIAATVSPINVAKATFVLQPTEMAMLCEGASNIYQAVLSSADGTTFSKICFDGAIYGRY